MNSKVIEIVTERLIVKMEAGTIPWRQTWKMTGWMPRNFVSRRPYSGINWLLLFCSQQPSPFWATMRQINDLGGRVIKGEHSTTITFWKMLKNSEDEEIPFIQYYRVFNLAQTEGIDWKVDIEKVSEFTPNEAAEAIVRGYESPPAIVTGYKPSYSFTLDRVQMPPAEAFESTGQYYATLFHELVHSTGHESRLKREFGEFFGDDRYSKEELVAEIGRCYLCALCGLDLPPLEEEAAAYLQNWTKKIKGEPALLIVAANKAAKAAERICHAESPAAMLDGGAVSAGVILAS